MSTPGCPRWPTGSWARRYILWALSLRRAFTWSEPSTSALPMRRRLRPIAVSGLTTELMHCHFSPRLSCSSAIRSSPLQRWDKLCLVHKRWDSRILSHVAILGTIGCDPQRAAAHADEAIALSVEHGLASPGHRARFFRGALLAQSGDLQLGIELMRN